MDWNGLSRGWLFWGLHVPPIIMLTGVESFEKIDLSASDSGIADFICKSQLSPALLEHSIRYVTRNRKMMRDLLRNEIRFHLFFDHAYESILLLDRQGCVLQANFSAEQMFCYEPGTMTGLYIHQLLKETLIYSCVPA